MLGNAGAVKMYMPILINLNVTDTHLNCGLQNGVSISKVEIISLAFKWLK